MNLLCAVLIHLWVAGWMIAMARAYMKSRLAAMPLTVREFPDPGVSSR